MAKQAVPTHKEDEILTPNEVGAMVRKSGNTIRQWIKDGLLEAIKYPGRVGQFGVRKSEAMKLISNSALADKVAINGN